MASLDSPASLASLADIIAFTAQDEALKIFSSNSETGENPCVTLTSGDLRIMIIPAEIWSNKNNLNNLARPAENTILLMLTTKETPQSVLDQVLQRGAIFACLDWRSSHTNRRTAHH